MAEYHFRISLCDGMDVPTMLSIWPDWVPPLCSVGADWNKSLDVAVLTGIAFGKEHARTVDGWCEVADTVFTWDVSPEIDD